MAHPELVIASAAQLDRLGDIPHGSPDKPDNIYTEYAEFMDDVAQQAVDGGGLCDRKLFELAFFAQFVRPVPYRPSVLPKPIRGSFDLADRLDEAAGRALAMRISTSRPYVDPSSFGVILGTGSGDSPTVLYEIEAIGDSEEPDGYRGTIGIDALWTPAKGDVVISEDDIQNHPILEIERRRGQVTRAVLTACINTDDMGLFVGQDVIRDNLDTTSYDYDSTTRRLAASIVELREAADRLGLPIR